MSKFENIQARFSHFEMQFLIHCFLFAETFLPGFDLHHLLHSPATLGRTAVYEGGGQGYLSTTGLCEGLTLLVL